MLFNGVSRANKLIISKLNMTFYALKYYTLVKFISVPTPSGIMIRSKTLLKIFVLCENKTF